MQRYKFLGLNQDYIEVCSISLRRDNLKEYFKFIKACKSAGLMVVEEKVK